MHKETFDYTVEDKEGKVFSETTHDNPSRKNSIPEVIDESRSSSDSERQINVINGGEGEKNNYFGTHINGTKSTSSTTRKSSSSSSSESSTNDFFLREEALKDYVSSSESSSKSLVPTSVYLNQDSTESQKSISPTASLPLQVMNRSGRYDPSRIPSSAFERSNSQLEWSIASNDSLFSIQLGQPSFKRDKAFMHDELRASRKLTKSGELDIYNRAPSITDIVEQIDIARKSVDIENLQTTETSHEASFKSEEERLGEDQNETKTLDQTACYYKSSKSNESSLTQKSGTSVQSGASPLKKRSRTLCYCFNCSWVFCYWPTCCQTWPSCNCSCCCLLFSCCWNCNQANHYDHASPILTEAEKNDSMKQDIQKEQSDKEESEVSSNSNSNYCNWFHCFSCPSCTWKLYFSMCKCCC